MNWYDLFSEFYDKSLEKLYYESRATAVKSLGLKDNDTVLDVACGTGANFTHLMESNPNIKIYATDYSDGMLEKAKKIRLQNGWENINIFQSDARALSAKHLQAKINKEMKFDHVICFLGLSVMPYWKLIIYNMLNLLKDGGRILIVDVYAEKRTFHTWLVEFIAKADLNREIWQTLKGMTKEFNCEYLPIKESKVGGKLFVATGKKC